MDLEEDPLTSRSKTFMKFSDTSVKLRKRNSEKKLRRNMRTELVTKHRNLFVSKKPWVDVDIVFKATYTMADLPELLDAMHSDSEQQHLMAAQGIRKILILDDLPIVKEIVDAGVLKFLMNYIQRFDYPQLQYESSLIIAFIACVKVHLNTIANSGGLQLLIQLLISSNEGTRVNAVWALKSIIADSVLNSNVIFHSQGLPLLIECLRNSKSLSMIEYSCWAISTLFLNKPDHDCEMAKEPIKVLAELIKTQNEIEILGECLLALSKITLGSEKKIDYLIETGVVPRVIQLLYHELEDIQYTTIVLVGIILSGNEQQIQLVLDLGIIEVFLTLINSSNENIRAEVVMSISNICESSKCQVDQLITAGVIPRR